VVFAAWEGGGKRIRRSESIRVFRRIKEHFVIIYIKSPIVKSIGEDTKSTGEKWYSKRREKARGKYLFVDF